MRYNYPYVYQSLPNDQDTIRVLHLFPTPDHASPLKGTLRYAKLSALEDEFCDKYTALSYVWGDASQTSIIYIDEKEVVITASLSLALRDLRDARRTLSVWADAVCINQQSIPERSSQVTMMASIYSRAEHTVIYLSSKPTREETDFLELATYRSQNLDHISAVSSAARKSHMLEKPWFHRTWTFQELIVSRDPWVQMGRKRAKWADFLFLSLWNGKHQQPNALSPDQLKLVEMDNARGGAKRRLLDLLQSRRGMDVTDPRDVVFAHLGIAAPEDWKPFFQVDYSKTLGEVYTAVARYIASTYSLSNKSQSRYYGGSNWGVNGFEILLDNLDDRALASRRQGLPSWAPDWSLPRRPKTWRHGSHGIRNWMFPRGLPVMPEDVSIMISVGFGFGTIEKLGPEVPLLKERFEGGDGQRETPFQTEYIKALEDLHEGIYQLGIGALRSDHDVLKPLRHFQAQYQVSELQMFINECSRWLLLHPPVLKRPERGIIREQPSQLNLPGCRLAVTSTGRLGSAPVESRVGDVIAVLVPFCDPVVLRAAPGAPRGSKLEQQIQKQTRRAIEFSKGADVAAGLGSQDGQLGKIPLGTTGNVTFQCSFVGQAEFQDIHWGYVCQRSQGTMDVKYGPELFVLY
ncbi:heterokaryon incompatibility protein-domain-containing protein [Podospora fimiseda]|uniref:Heterokaryon incompatibility protein-domain-containing protein n=1 Tax=Podospora fimiseda TaxID=252190 RepID=A0AAN7BTM2_9PEZI|nr:heterokaryon incompatibility protein-domain-containing protein [Podospora fimiseda]